MKTLVITVKLHGEKIREYGFEIPLSADNLDYEVDFEIEGE